MYKAFEHNGVEGHKIFSVIGDSTFFHSGVTGLMDVVYNKGNSTVIIADNRITGMTGHQENPGTGRTLKGEETVEIDVTKICKALGVSKVVEVNPLNLEEMEAAIKEAANTDETMVIVTKWPCALLKDQPKPKELYRIDEEKCKKCKACLKVGCPAIFNLEGKIQIDDTMCNGCGFCAQVCRFDAIEKVGE
jgi:indolepyruvate ferredoxin oxidoreductase alpha subunit